MKWTAKAQMAQVLSHMPRGRQVHAWMQRHVTKTLPMPEQDFRDRCRIAERHLTSLRQHFGADRLGALTLLEFGAGWDLIVPQVFFGAGVNRQLLFDLHRLCDPPLVRNAAGRLQAAAAGQAISQARPLPAWPGSFDAYLEALGITYNAPADARQTGLAADSIDAVTTSLVLEHVPPDAIASIYREMHRVLRPDGIMCSSIDMSDHFSHSDSTITPWNFLQLPERAWQRVNADLIYQNRLRGFEHLALIADAGFEVLLAEERVNGTRAAFDAVQPAFVAPFNAMSPEQLMPTQVYVVARRAV
jgi:hypothetical protein